MPQSLQPIPAGVDITERGGPITVFFRESWQALIDGFQRIGTVATVAIPDRNSAYPTTAIYTTNAAATFRANVYLEKSAIDGVASTLTVTIGWTRNGVPLTHVFTALATDIIGANLSDTWEFLADEATDITIAVAYTSTTPGNMHFLGSATAEQLA